MRAPLQGTRVIELCANVAGPFVGTVLAQLGAEVTKVERPGTGDDARSWGPPFVADDSVMFHVMNGGKASVVLDLRADDDREQLWALLADADVLVENWRPGALAGMGFGPDEVAARCPDVVYCSISAFGSDGPRAERPGYDSIVQAHSGLMGINGSDGEPPTRVGTSVVDMGSGMWAVIGILAALIARAETSRAPLVQTSLLESALAWIPYQLAGHVVTGREPARLGTGLAMVAPYRAYATDDGWVMLAAGNDATWPRLCEALERADLAAREDLATNPGRVAARAELDEVIGAVIAQRSTATWLERLDAAGVPCAPVNSLADVLADPQTRSLDMIGRAPDGAPAVGLPVRFDGVRPPRRAAPPLGAAEPTRAADHAEHRAEATS